MFFLTYKVTDMSRIVEFRQKASNIIAELRYTRPMDTIRARMEVSADGPSYLKRGTLYEIASSPPAPRNHKQYLSLNEYAKLHIEPIIRKMLNAAPIV